MKYDNDWLRSRVGTAGPQVEYLFFYGHKPHPTDEPTSACLSQWYVRPFTHEGVIYPTAEHWMMAEKARLFEDAEMREQIWQSDTPAKAKALGRKVSGFDDTVWKRERSGIVVAGNLLKFGQHTDLRDFLLATGDRVLVEAAPRDRIWGIGMGRERAAATPPSQWRGQNLLGYALMEVRDRLEKLTLRA